MRYVFWDLDGTLLTTGRAGIIAWEQAVLEVFGAQIDLTGLKTAGLIDPEIAVMLSRMTDQVADDAQVQRLLRSYESRLPACLPLRQGRVLPNVIEILERLKSERAIQSHLLTGNTRAGAAAKLSHYGLTRYFCDGGFSDGCDARTEVALCAMKMISSAHRDRCHIYVVGDTPHDIRCAEVIGACSIAVATGEYGIEELRSHGAHIALEQLPDPNRFIALLTQPAH